MGQQSCGKASEAEVTVLTTLYIVGTPIGNLEDITLRAIRTLREVSVIAAEDTRQTRKLLSHFDIHTPMVSYREHNQRTAGPALIQRLLAGQSVALVTDAGMPAISDPGEELVREALAAGVPVTAIPGPTAFVTALVLSGLPTTEFTYYGFLPQRKKDRTETLRRIAEEPRTVLLYEAPHRILDTLKDLEKLLETRTVAAARELTKIHEQVVRGTAGDLREHFKSHTPRGEFVLVIQGATPAVVENVVVTDSSIREAVDRLIATGKNRKDAMKEVAVKLGITKRDVYQSLLGTEEEE